MGRDKKVEGGAMRFVLLDALGQARVRAAVPAATLVRPDPLTPRRTSPETTTAARGPPLSLERAADRISCR